ncbi:MAG: ABC transporter permease [Anaerolineales bacterium]
MRLIRLFLFKSIQTRPLRLLLSAFGIVIGVAGILAIGITNQSALDAVTQLFAETSGKASLSIVPAKDEASGFSETLLRRVSFQPGIQVTVPSLHLQTLIAQDAASQGLALNFFGTTLGGLTLYGVDAQIDEQVRPYNIVAGRFLAAEPGAKEIVLVESFAADKELAVGDTVELVTPSGVEDLELVGLMAKEGPGQTNNGAFGVIPLETAQKLFDRQGKLDQIDIVVQPAENTTQSLEQIKASLQARLGRDYNVIYPASQGRRMTQMLGNFQIGLNFLSGMALFVGAFLIFNAFSMTVVERTREIGMLRTVGMTRAQVSVQVLSEAVLLGVISSAVGLLGGILLASGLSQMMGVLLGQNVSVANVPTAILAAGIVVGIGVTLVAAFLPAVQAARISPLEALRVRAGGQAGRLLRYGWILGLVLLAVSTIILILNPFPYDVQFRLGGITVFALFLGGTLVIPASIGFWERILRPVISLVYGRSGLVGSSNVQRSKLRTTLTVAALMIGVAMIIVVWAMTGSFKGDLDEWLRGYVGGDLYVTSSLPIRRNVWNRLEAEPGVQAVAPVRYFEVDWYTPERTRETLVFMAIDPGAHSRVTSFVFSKDQTDPEQALQQLAAGDAVFISSVLAEKYGLGTGDNIELRTRTGDHAFQIAGVVVDYYNQGLVLEGSLTDMQRYFRMRDANALLLKVAPDYNIDEVRQRLDDLYGKREHLVIESNRDLLDQVTTLMDQAFGIFDVLVVIAMLVAALGITNTLTMNVIERTREIGMLRSVGMTQGQVVGMVLSEAGLMGLVGGVLGLVFGIILARIFMAAMTAMSGYALEFFLPLDRALLAVLIGAGVANLAALLPAWRAARIRILEAIQFE